MGIKNQGGEKNRRKWTGNRNLELSPLGSKACFARPRSTMGKYFKIIMISIKIIIISIITAT